MGKKIYTIPPDLCFVDALAAGIWRDAEKDSLRLAEYLIFLPTRRAARHLRDAFLRLMEGGATLLPRMQVLGDMEEATHFATHADIILNLPPAITQLRRQMLLIQCVLRKESAMPLDQAAQLADSLGKLLDQVQTERLDFTKLRDLVSGRELAEHWQKTLNFLEILTDVWPTILGIEGCMDIVERRNKIFAAQGESWQKKPPNFPIIAAGSTASVPSTRDLLAIISGLPKGAVILPGLDSDLDEDAWQAITESHPQFNMKRFLESCDVRRDDVTLWHGVAPNKNPRPRLLQEAMRPADVTDAWQKLSPTDFPRDGLQGMYRLSADTIQAEATSIALMMRGALEVAGKTASLVTLDRDLAGRVGAILARWGLLVNDSAGQKITTAPVGSFLLAILAAAKPVRVAGAGVVALLSLLKHPICAWGMAPAQCRALARQLELRIFRAEDRGGEESAKLREARATQIKLDNVFAPIRADWDKKIPLMQRLEDHIILAKNFAQSDGERGEDRLWSGEAGDAMTDWLEDFRQATKGSPDVTGDDYAHLIEALLQTVMVRPVVGLHPRLSIMGPLEARLWRADLTILGGMNDGVWPSEGEIDPWMSRPMKSDFGLPVPERQIGLSAHDFVQLASGGEVVITRALRVGRSPSVPSRFLLQVEAVLRALGYHDAGIDFLAVPEPWQKWALDMDAPHEIKPCDPPAPIPPLESRPRILSVTEIATYIRNPYGIYAKHILKLRKLLPLEEEIGAKEKGNLFHKALENFFANHPREIPPHAREELLAEGDKVFSDYAYDATVQALWRPRFAMMVDAILEDEREKRAQGTSLAGVEVAGAIQFADGKFTLKGRADRIDIMGDGTYAVIDYKTGTLPAVSFVNKGYDPQLPLLSLMVERGGFEAIEENTISAFSYMKLGGKAGVEETTFPRGKPPVPIEDLIEGAKNNLENLIEKYSHSATPYDVNPSVKMRPKYDDYAHLSRLKEWGARGDDEGGDNDTE